MAKGKAEHYGEKKISIKTDKLFPHFHVEGK